MVEGNKELALAEVNIMESNNEKRSAKLKHNLLQDTELISDDDFSEPFSPFSQDSDDALRLTYNNILSELIEIQNESSHQSLSKEKDVLESSDHQDPGSASHGAAEVPDVSMKLEFEVDDLNSMMEREQEKISGNENDDILRSAKAEVDEEQEDESEIDEDDGDNEEVDITGGNHVPNCIDAVDDTKDEDDLVSSESDDEDEEGKSVGADEIDSLLEEGLPEDYRRRSKPKFSVKELVVLEEKGKNSLEALPEGWLEVRHCSGIPIYLHRKTRVCTLAKPYSLGPSSVRKHLIPLSGIPCFSYKRALEREAEELKAEERQKSEECSPSKRFKSSEEATDGSPSASIPLTFVPLPMAKVETAEETNTLFTIQPLELREYCQKLFRFKTIQCKRFKNWNAKRKHTKMQKRLKVQRPSLPDGVKLIKFPVKPLGNGDGSGRSSREYVLNPKGKSSVCILHEYVQHALRQQPIYHFKELEHASTPYSATVLINNIQYGTGFGTSKKQAKSNAAKETLEVLIPQIKDTLQPPDKSKPTPPPSDIGYSECFGQIELDDPRIATLCQNISEPTPYSLLLTCIQRNYGKLTDGSLQFDMVSTLGNQKIKFKMTFREHIVEIIAPNKKEGKQVASQTMLAKIHPHIKNFGAFIRLYGNDSIKSCKEKKQDQQEVTELQSKASVNSPNFAILTKLREEMLKLCTNDADTKQTAPDTYPKDARPCRPENSKETQTEVEMVA